MAGFVDPAFKSLRVTEPNFLVWRISKLPEENYEAKEVKREFWGKFFEEDSYIVYSSSPVKKPVGIGNRGMPSRMEINVHFWLGSKLSDDDRRRTIIKSIEVDEVLDGAAVVHREIQGHESNHFLSYFKTGLTTMRGEITSVLRQAHVDSRPKLFQLSERASTLLLTECPSISWTFANTEGILVLEAKDKVFLWLGRDVSNADKFLALKFERQMANQGGDKKLIWVIDLEEEKLPKEDLRDFQEYLRLWCKEVSIPNSEDYVVLLAKSRRNTELYKVITEEGSSTIIYMRDGPLEQSDLGSMEICLIHHYTNCVWVWVSRKVPEDERSRAINIGIAYLENKPKTGAVDKSKMSVKRVVEGLEPAEFKLLFRNWIDSFPAQGSGYFRKATARPVNMAFTADKLEDSPCLAVETQLLDCGSGNMRILRVNGEDLEPLEPEQFGIFHASFSYLVHYSYNVRGKTQKILYYWLGRNAAAQEKYNPIWPSLKNIPDLSDATIRIRIEQDYETPHFHAIFQGKILVLTRSLYVSSNKKWSLNDYPIILLKVRGGDLLNTLTTEVEPRPSSLNSFNVFILRTPQMSFIWHGRSSKGDEREMAKIIARKWVAAFSVVLEGCECEDFWKLLGGFKCYSSEEEKVEPEVNVPPRAFKCSWFDGDLKVMEIVNFAQSDLGVRDIIILDAWKTVFVWTGNYVPESEIFGCEALVKAYLRSDPCGRKPAIPIIHVSQGREPAIFRGFFSSWDTASTVPYDHQFVNELLREKKKPAYATADMPADAAVMEAIAVTDKKLPSELAKVESVLAKAEPVTAEAEPVTSSFPPDMLQGKPAEEIPKGVDPNRKEDYLSDQDFFSVFGMTREFFNKLPQWKRKHLKKSVGFI